MAIVKSVVRKSLLSKGDPLTDTRETWIATMTFTKLNTEDNVTMITGFSEIYSYHCTGNIAAKPYNATVSGGTITFIDGGTAANTIGAATAIGRK